MIRRLQESDVSEIHSVLETHRHTFDIGNGGRFYEYSELELFVYDPSWIALVAINDTGDLTGFLMCKQMSDHWALLDTFYVLPRYRGLGYGRALSNTLKQTLTEIGVQYLSLLANADSPEVQRRFKFLGFAPQKSYVWMDQTLEASKEGSSDG
jgi:GNAT superfamily N-acetyltransferase